MVSILAVTYFQETELEVFIGSLLLQTRPDWKLYLVHDGVPPEKVCRIVGRYADPRITFWHSEERNGKWGHPNRKKALEALEGNPDDFVLQTNADNYYCPDFVKQMLDSAKPGVGIVMSDTLHSHLNYGYHRSQLFEGGLDLGCFIVRYDVAKSVGFKFDHFSADGAYAVDCGAECARRGLSVAHIARALFVHN
jgi:GT2 family glycosyltransferase